MYTAFLYFYLRYRYLAPRNLYLALVFGALTFYSYSPGQVIMAVTGVLLLISDFRYHWQNRKVGLFGLGLLVVLAAPYARFLITRGAENYRHLQILGSYWTEPLPLTEKLRLYISEYLRGLSPAYWFLPNNADLPRHLMKGYGNLLRPAFPFAILGLGICLKNIRSSMHRLVLIALIAAPTGAALVGIGITRLLVFVIPETLLITLGVIACLNWLGRHRLPEMALAFGLFIPLVAFNFYMLNDSLVNGPRWYSDYGLGGMQYGASQIFSEAQNYLKSQPQTHIILSPSWSNGTDVVARFFMADPLPIELGSIDGYLFEHKPLDPNTLFIMIPSEYKEMLASNKFTDIRLEKIMPFPDGTPGFYFVRLRYVDNIDAILEAEKEARVKLQTGYVTIDSQQVSIAYSMLDMGTIDNAFDGNTGTLIRSLEANPLVIELTFPQARETNGVTILVGGVATRITARLQLEGQDTAQTFQIQVPQTPLPREVYLDFGGPQQVASMHLEVLSVNDVAPAHIHIWEIKLK